MFFKEVIVILSYMYCFWRNIPTYLPALHGLLSAESEQKWNASVTWSKCYNEIYQLDFLKVAVLNRSTKGAKTSSFCRDPGHSLLSAKSEQNEMDKQIALSTNSSYQ